MVHRAVCLLFVVAAAAAAAGAKFTEPQGHMLIFNGVPRTPWHFGGAAREE